MLNYAQHFTTGLAHSYWNIVEACPACPACPFPVRTFEHRRKWLKRQELRVTRLSAQPSLWIFFFSLIRHCSEHILNMFELFEDWVKFCIFCYEFGDEILSDSADGAPSCTESPELPEVLCCEISRARPRLQQPEHAERLVERHGRHIEPRMEPAEGAEERVEQVEPVERVCGVCMRRIIRCRYMVLHGDGLKWWTHT